MNEFGQLLASFWGMFENLTVPLLGIKFSTFFIGIFAVQFSILILHPIISIGRSSVSFRVRVHRYERKNSGKGDDPYA